MDKVHYDLWMGPAPKRPFNPNRFHYNWHWQWDYGNGDLGNQGAHEFDVARWGLGVEELPVKVSSSGGYFAFKDSAAETANTQIAVCEYADGRILQFEVRGVYTNAESGMNLRIGNIFYGSKGWMELSGKRWYTYFSREKTPGPSWKDNDLAKPEYRGGGIFGNFLYAIRSGKKEDLDAEIGIGYLSTAPIHLANIAYRVGREVNFDPKKEKIIGDKQATKLLRRQYRKPFVVLDKV